MLVGENAHRKEPFALERASVPAGMRGGVPCSGTSLLPPCSAAGIGESCRLSPSSRRVAAVGLLGNRQLKSVTNAGRDWKKPKQQIEVLVTQVNCSDLFAPLLFITALD